MLGGGIPDTGQLIVMVLFCTTDRLSWVALLSMVGGTAIIITIIIIIIIIIIIKFLSTLVLVLCIYVIKANHVGNMSLFVIIFVLML